MCCMLIQVAANGGVGGHTFDFEDGAVRAVQVDITLTPRVESTCVSTH